MLNFLGIGAQKAGTTWLYEMLRKHPEVDFPVGKEAHYWNKLYPNTPVTTYLSQFNRDDAIQGEITPAYGHLNLQTIKAVHEALPDLRLIYIIRDPVERAWSSALMALERSELEFHEASEQWFVDHFKSQGSIQRGNYSQAIKNWKKYYADEKILLLLHNDIRNDPNEMLTKCFRHLGVRGLIKDELHQLDINKRVFANRKHNLPQSLRTILEETYTEMRIWPVNLDNS